MAGLTTKPPSFNPPPSRLQRRVLLVAALGSFLSSLSSSIVGVVLPRIGEWAGLGVHEVAWVTLIPMLVISALLLPAGWAGDNFGHRKVYVVGGAFATVGSLGCALAPGYAVLLLFRGVQGIGAALAMASAPALVTLTTDRAHRGGALGVTSTALYVGLTLGPPLGGWLGSLADFRAVFFAQVPLSFILFVVSVTGLPEIGGLRLGRTDGPRGGHNALNPRGSAAPPDLWGAVLLAAGVIAILVALARGGVGSVTVTAGFGLAGLVLLAGFIMHERSARDPLLDLRLFSDRSFFSATLGAFLNYVALFHANFLLPFYLIDERGMDVGHAGTLLMVMPLIMSVVAGPSGSLSDRIGSRSLASGGMLLLALGLGLLATCDAGTPLVVVTMTMVLIGLGTGVFVTPNTSTLMASASGEAQGSAAGVMALARTLGMMVGTAMAAMTHETVRVAGIVAGMPAKEASAWGLGVAWGIGSVVALVAAGVVLVRSRPIGDGRKLNDHPATMID